MEKKICQCGTEMSVIQYSINIYDDIFWCKKCGRLLIEKNHTKKWAVPEIYKELVRYANYWINRR